MLAQRGPGGRHVRGSWSKKELRKDGRGQRGRDKGLVFTFQSLLIVFIDFKDLGTTLLVYNVFYSDYSYSLY